MGALISAHAPDRSSRLWAYGMLAFGLLVFLALAPFAKLKLPAEPVFMPVVQTILIVNDLITAILLFAQVHVTRRRSVLFVGCAYAFGALLATVHLLSFPGLFGPAGLVGGNQQTTAYLFVFWHGGFALGLLAYAWARHREARPSMAETAGPARGIAMVLAAAAILALLATSGAAWLPPILAGNTYSSEFNVLRHGQWVLTAAAMYAIWRVPGRTTLDLWLIVVLGNMSIEIALVAIFNAGRYDVGFYAGRVFALLGSTVVLAAMLFEQARLYARLITAQATALSELRLRQGREALRKALVAGGAGAWSADLDSSRAWWSIELEEAAGYAAGAFPGTRQACLRHVHPEDVPALRRAYRKAVARDVEFDFECRFLAAGGEWRWLSGRGRRQPAADGGRGELAGSAMDVTQRKRAEASARELDSSLRDIADHLPVLAWMTDADGAPAWFNQKWHDYTGTSRRHHAFRGWRHVAHRESGHAVTAGFEAGLLTGDPFEGVIHWRAFDGSHRPFLTRWAPIRDGQGNVVRWLGTSTDILEQHSAQQALRAADRRKDAFLDTLVHELRTPLAPIRHAVELLQRTEGVPPDTARMHAIIGRQSLQLSRLVEDLLDAGRITQGKLAIRRERTSLAAALHDAVDAVRPSCEASGQEVFLSGGDDVHLVADPARLRQVFVNLLNNAAKFTPKGGRISVRAILSGPEVHVTVQDNGIGIPAGYLPHIFELFSQSRPGRDRRKSGLGIGLALARAIVAGHGGAITVMSPGPDGGAEFTVTLPLEPPTRSADIRLPGEAGLATTGPAIPP